MTITTVARYTTRDGEREQILAMLEPVFEATAAERGCRYFHALLPTSEANTIVLIEGWEDEDALNEHRSTSHFQEVLLRMVVPELHDRDVVETTSVFEAGTGAMTTRAS